jgi:ribosomal 50S subunit-recycling heat shock protein
MMIAGKVKSGDNIEVQLDKDSQAVFVINGKTESMPEKPKKEKSN